MLEHEYRCYYCGKLRPESHLREQRVLITGKVMVCNDKYINDCVDDSLVKYNGYTRCAK